MEIPGHCAPFVQDQTDRIVDTPGLVETKYRLAGFMYKRPKHPVPYDQHPSEIAIDVLRVTGVMQAVVSRCIEDQLQEPKPSDGRGVCEHGIQLNDRIGDNDHRRRKPNEHHGYPENQTKR